EVNGFNLSLQYLTPEYRWLRSDKMESLPSWINQNQNKYHFLLKIGLHDRSLADINSKEMKYYLSYRFQEDVYLEGNSKKIPCTIAHLENQQHNGNNKLLHLAFDSGMVDLNELILVIDSDVISSVPVKIRINISNLPQLKL
ncbi:MAG: hypothetical protein ACKO96_44240, partial [Flammeovirgaceae bacterium]